MENTLKFDVERALSSKKILKRYDALRNVYRDSISPSASIGNCSRMYSILKPDSYEDFYRKETEYAEAHRDGMSVEERGLTYDDICSLAEMYKALVEEKDSSLVFNAALYFNLIICHAFIETFDGMKKEEDVIRYITSLGYNTQKIAGIKDARSGVDILVTGKGSRFYVQVKPCSFFRGNKEDLKRDKVMLCRKREETLMTEGTDTYYMIYESDPARGTIRWAMRENGKMLFPIWEIFSYDTETLMKTDHTAIISYSSEMMDAIVTQKEITAEYVKI